MNPRKPLDLRFGGRKRAQSIKLISSYAECYRMQLLNTPWLPLLLAFAAGMVTLAVFRTALPALWGHRASREVAAKAAWFHERVVDLRERATTLDQHSDEYVAVFNDDHWSSLMKMLAQLETVDRQIQRLLASGKRDDAATLLNYICDSRRGSSMEQVADGLDEVAELVNWEVVVNSMLKRVLSNLEAATVSAEKVAALPTSRRRQPTIVTLADLKKKLLEDESFQTES